MNEAREVSEEREVSKEREVNEEREEERSYWVIKYLENRRFDLGITE